MWKALILLFLCTPLFADTAIYCPKCKQHVYDYKQEFVKGEMLKGESFVLAKDCVPLFGFTIDTENIVCPIDRTPINGWEYWGKQQKFKSFNFAYNAVSVLTKIDGKFVWVPFDMPYIKIEEN